MFKIILPKIRIEIEKWKYNKNYKLYVSDYGNFKGLDGEEIKPMIDKSGYLVIPICNNKLGIIKYLFCHRVVMETWCPKINMWKDSLTVDHLDHNKRNNNYKNLEWVTKEENQKRARKDFIDIDIAEKAQKIKNKDYTFIAKTSKTTYTLDGFDKVLCFLTENNINMANANFDKVKRNLMKKIMQGDGNYCGYIWSIKERKGE